MFDNTDTLLLHRCDAWDELETHPGPSCPSDCVIGRIGYDQ